MASRAFTQRLLAPIRGITTRPTTAFRAGRTYSTAAEKPTTPPLLQTLKGDLKNAMRAKDAPRLAVLRSVITTTLNASKTPKPIRTDLELVALLRKTQHACLDAAKGFRDAKREDLAQKEEEQAAVAKEYVASSGVKILAEEELRALVAEAVEAAKAAGVEAKALTGEVYKRVVAPRKNTIGGEWQRIPEMVKDLTTGST